MQFRIRNQNHDQGGVLMVSLFITTAILIGLGSYLLLVRAQYVSVARSQSWNGALAMAEAGVEEALAQLNPGAIAKTITVDRTANGWGAAANGRYGPVSHSVVSNGTYSVIFTDAVHPTIYSTGYVTLPNISATMSRVVYVATTNVPLFNVSLAARTNISMNGNGLSANSFDSSNTNLSTGGRYDTTKTTTNGDVAVLYGTLDLGNHNVSGDVYLGPTATLNANTNQVSGTVHTDFNADFPQVVLPSDAGTWTTLAPPNILGGIINGVLSLGAKSYDYVFNTSGDYILPVGGSIYVNTNAHVRLKIASGGTDKVLVAGTGSNAGNLTIYIAAANFTIGSNGTIDGGKAANLTYFGLPSNTSITLNGNAYFTGALYAPSAILTLNGSGNNDYDIVGSCVVASVTFNGHFMFHFDADLLNSGANRGYVAVSWGEL